MNIHFLMGLGARVSSLAALVSLAACVAPQPPLYYWGNYPQQVYRDLAEEGSLGERIGAMETIREQALAQRAELPPGFRAHLGMLYLQADRANEALQQLTEEKATFPESTILVEHMINTSRTNLASAQSGSVE